MDDWGLIVAYCRALRRRCATRTADLGWGEATFCDALPAVYDLNGIAVATLPPGGLRQVVDAAERLHSGLDHRRLWAYDDAVANDLEALDEGWDRARHVAMVLPPAVEVPRPAHKVVEVDVHGLAAHEYAFLAELEWATPEVAGQIAAATVRAAERGATVRGFHLRRDGAPVASCVAIVQEVEGGSTVAQVDALTTLPEHRGHGYGQAVFAAAISACREAEPALVHLFADRDDWPRTWYARLGFHEVGTEALFTRTSSLEEPNGPREGTGGSAGGATSSSGGGGGRA